ncbi:MAG: c-type cytochrome, partial [Planctomycetes bacterium]|nr:c-type cytochrome [Planctomycetota bacterium]
MLKFLKAGLLGTALLATAGSALAADVADGEKVFRKCAACHSVGEGAKSRVGPELNDVFGRQAGTLDGFKYSAAMIAAGEGGVTWNEQTLTQFLV